MINVTLNEILNASPILSTIAQKPINGADAFKIARLLREVDKEITTFDETRKTLIDKYGARDDEGELVVEENTIKIKDDCIDDYNQAVTTMLMNEVTINANPLSMDSLSALTITPQQALMIEKFFE